MVASMCKAADLWEVVGDDCDDGVTVFEGGLLTSSVSCDRLSIGTVVRELELTSDGRLHYVRVTGSGPDIGWVAIRTGTKDLLTRKLSADERLTLFLDGKKISSDEIAEGKSPDGSDEARTVPRVVRVAAAETGVESFNSFGTRKHCLGSGQNRLREENLEIDSLVAPAASNQCEVTNPKAFVTNESRSGSQQCLSKGERKHDNAGFLSGLAGVFQKPAKCKSALPQICSEPVGTPAQETQGCGQQLRKGRSAPGVNRKKSDSLSGLAGAFRKQSKCLFREVRGHTEEEHTQQIMLGNDEMERLIGLQVDEMGIHLHPDQRREIIRAFKDECTQAGVSPQQLESGEVAIATKGNNHASEVLASNVVDDDDFEDMVDAYMPADCQPAWRQCREIVHKVERGVPIPECVLPTTVADEDVPAGRRLVHIEFVSCTS